YEEAYYIERVADARGCVSSSAACPAGTGHYTVEPRWKGGRYGATGYTYFTGNTEVLSRGVWEGGCFCRWGHQAGDRRGEGVSAGGESGWGRKGGTFWAWSWGDW